MFGALCMLASAQVAPLSLTVEGEGYLRFAKEGRVFYAKSARLIARGGKLSHESGATLMPLVTLSEGAEAVEIATNGEIAVVARGSKTASGRLLLARFPDAAKGAEVGGLLAFSQRPTLGFPGEEGFGTIRSDVSKGAAAQSDPSIPASPPPGSAKARIEALGMAELDSDRLRLGEVARISGHEDFVSRLASLDLGPTPALGVAQRVAEYRLIAALKASRIEPKSLDIAWGTGPEVRRKAQTIPHERFVEAARKSLGDAGAGLHADPKDSLPDFVAPLGELELRAEETTASGTQATVRVAVFVKGRRVNSRTIRLYGDASTYGVKAGATVKVRFVAGGVVGEIAGRARSNALIGQNVEVLVAFDPSQPPSSHLGTVLGPGLVEVKLP